MCAGKMTKQINRFMDLEKEYTGTMVLGKTTPSVDLETEIDNEQAIDHISEEDILKTTEMFRGKIMQTPPIYSAIKKDGEPLYKKARKGVDVKIEPRAVESMEFEIIKIDLPEVHFRLVCSKGFYVRSLVRDFGNALGVGALMSALERTRIGDSMLWRGSSPRGHPSGFPHLETVTPRLLTTNPANPIHCTPVAMADPLFKNVRFAK